MPILILLFATFISTLLGGLFALRFKDKLHLIVGFSAGAVLGVTFFDLMPEALELGKSFYSVKTLLSLVVLGFSLYLVIDRLILLHGYKEEECSKIGNFGAGTLSIHSFLDGISIGFAFQFSETLGAIVALAVIAHNFSDGINTVSIVLKNKGDKIRSFKWLIIDAIAPTLGIITTLFFAISQDMLSLLLALFSGFFLYIGASDLIPESYHNHPVAWTTIATLLGIGTLYLIISLA